MVKDENDLEKTWKAHEIPKLKESELGIKDWADKSVFLVDFGREKKTYRHTKMSAYTSQRSVC